jgi:16S rRNA (uracil1498-N3)-methyltransferase
LQRIVVDAEQIVGDNLHLTDDQHHYLQRVLRLKIGDRFLALNGKGDGWLATLQADAQAQLSQAPETLLLPQRSPQLRITLAAALPKQGFDEVVRQVTELGVDRIVPIMSDRTLLRPSAHKLQRWRKIAAEAGEQSERLTVPALMEPFAWQDWLQRESQDCRYLCVARRDAPLLVAACITQPSHAVEVAVGPEGGWTEAEVAAAIANGYQPVSLGRSILRAVTASVTALSILQSGFDFATMYQPQNM